MIFIRFNKFLFKASVGLLVLALLLPTTVAMAAVPCNDGEPDGIYSAQNGFPIKQNPNVCTEDNALYVNLAANRAIQTSTEAGEDQVAAGDPDPAHVFAPRIATAGTIFSQQASVACLDFNDRTKWRGGGQNWSYAGWGIQALNAEGQGIYKENASFELEQYYGDGLSLKLNHFKPFRSQIISPEFEVKAGDRVIAKVSYLINDPTPNHSVSAEISVHLAGDTSAPVKQGFFKGPNTWGKLESTFINESQAAAKIQVLLQGNNLYLDHEIAIYFDNVEILVNDVPAIKCEFAHIGLKFD
ncbi:hypothetical protein KFU94_19240 [Chloroflexi bacterium TSY]|nr:hypothetical protein [Chloroflexi bacterium TSY]